MAVYPAEYWVEASSLRTIPRAIRRSAAWPGAYRRTYQPGIDIAIDRKGSVSISGAIVAGYGDAPSWESISYNQIGLDRRSVGRGAIDVTLTEGIAVTYHRRDKRTEFSDGTKNCHCRVRLRVHGPVLIAKDVGCGRDPSGFEGVRLRSGGIPNPRRDHAQSLTSAR